MKKPKYANCSSVSFNQNGKDAVLSFFQTYPLYNEALDIVGEKTTMVANISLGVDLLKKLRDTIDASAVTLADESGKQTENV